MSQDIIYFQGLSRYFRHRSLFLTHYLIISSHFKIARLHSDSVSEFSSSDYSLIPSDVQLVIFFFFWLNCSSFRAISLSRPFNRIVCHSELPCTVIPTPFLISSYLSFHLNLISHYCEWLFRHCGVMFTY